MHFDTHCHLDSIETVTTEDVLKAAKAANVTKMVTIAVDTENLDTVLELSQKYKETHGVYCTQGIHPHTAHQWNAEVLTKIKQTTLDNAAHVVALGEMGLDYHYMLSTREQQIECLEQQLELARVLSLPVVLHTREADEDMESILRNFTKAHKNFKGVLHSFTSGMKLATWAMEEGFYLGFNGIMSFKNAQNVRDVLLVTPKEQILSETDSPYLAPVPHRGKVNQPQFVVPIIDLIGQLRPDVSKEQLYANGLKFYSIKAIQ